MELEVSTVVDRPVAVVWNFYAVHHVENHPRWDPDLWRTSATAQLVSVPSYSDEACGSRLRPKTPWRSWNSNPNDS
jgi:hypothetical protein